MAAKHRLLWRVIFAWLVVGVAVWQMAILLPSLNFDLTRGYLVLTLLGVLTELMAVNFPQGRVSGGFAVVVSGFLIYGYAPAVWIWALAALVGQGIANRGNPLRTTIFNAAQYTLSLVAAEKAYFYCGGTPAFALTRLSGFWPLLIFALVYYLVNQLLVYIYVASTQNPYFPPNLPDTLAWDGYSYLITFPLGVLMTVIYFKVGPWAMMLLFVPLLATQLILGSYVRLKLVNRELGALYELSKRVKGVFDLSRVSRIILEELHKIMSYHTGIILLWSGEQECFTASAVISPYAGELEKMKYYLSERFVRLALDSRQGEIVADSRADARLAGEPGLVQVFRSLLLVPLVTGDDLPGILLLGHKGAHAFAERDLAGAVAISGQASVAVAAAALYRRCEELSVTDDLTGLCNRSGFFARAQEELERSRRYDLKFTVALVCISGMQAIRERFGFLAGDGVLKDISGLFKQNKRSVDLCASYGEDKFIFLLPETDAGEAVKMLRRLELVVRDRPFFPAEEIEVHVSLRLGLATYPDQAEGLDQLVQAAGLVLDRPGPKGGAGSVL